MYMQITEGIKYWFILDDLPNFTYQSYTSKVVYVASMWFANLVLLTFWVELVHILQYLATYNVIKSILFVDMMMIK